MDRRNRQLLELNPLQEANDGFIPDVFHDTCLNMELVTPRDGDAPRLRNKDGQPTDKSNNNPILDARTHKVEHPAGHKALLAANAIVENMFAQVDNKCMKEMVSDECVKEIEADSECNLLSVDGNFRRCCRFCTEMHCWFHLNPVEMSILWDGNS
jgi:hypothetical protein